MTIEPEQTQASRPRAIPVDSFGNRLMLARAHAGHISIREAAELCDIGRGAWTNWEKGARPADIIDIATVVADKLGVDRDWLLFGGHLTETEGRPLRRRSRRGRHGHGGSASPNNSSTSIPRPVSSVPVTGPIGQKPRGARRTSSTGPAAKRRPTLIGPGVRTT